jgi:hypothetical protein
MEENEVNLLARWPSVPPKVLDRAFSLGYWRLSRRSPFRYRRMMAFERRKRTAPYMIAIHPYRTPAHRITDYLR